ncbi:PadR family transcriptional regulator [Arthrobacter russicus]|jgi:DNA-binding PadR family transcriptional regulator|uniref:DNA-binding PadR family transcriptional regulator n=1 Tax=Arthrobacter russicus TaxID=172040 RepID=A0ABU1JE48_9MICC|nr:PadR family transcriptional regulator [Arthrobacter russicus]MDR6270716.1 DNA-binding PadR family transcriptional regulator [Arthrobacter russicus]
MTPYATRLLVLGVVRIFEPAHGYLLLQELNSWRVDQWANVKPGSIYSTLRTLSKDGLLHVVSTTEAAGSAAKTSYRTTPDGIAEFERLVKRSITDVGSPSIATTMSGIGFLPFLERAEVIELFEQRQAALAAESDSLHAAVRDFAETGPVAPPHVVEQFHFLASQVRGNLDWTTGILGRLRSGAYSFRGEPPVWTPPEHDPIWGNRTF